MAPASPTKSRGFAAVSPSGPETSRRGRRPGAGCWSAVAAMLPLVLSACSAAEQPDEESAPSPSADEAETDDEVPDDEQDDQDQQEESAPESSPESSSGPAAEPSPPPELPGGGDELFPDRRLIALYGAPGSPRWAHWVSRMWMRRSIESPIRPKRIKTSARNRSNRPSRSSPQSPHRARA